MHSPELPPARPGLQQGDTPARSFRQKRRVGAALLLGGGKSTELWAREAKCTPPHPEPPSEPPWEEASLAGGASRRGHQAGPSQR